MKLPRLFYPIAFSLGTFVPIASAQDPVSIPDGVAGPLDAGQNRGFRVRSAQAPEFTEILNSVDRAVQQLNGTLRDINGDPVENEAESGPNDDGSFDVDVINFERDSDPEVSISDLTTFSDDVEFPGIPGTGGHTSLFATEIMAFLELPAGNHKLTVQVFVGRVDETNDNGLVMYAGTNPRDFFATELATFVRSPEAPAFASTPWDFEFTITAPVAGVYPVRLVYWAQEKDAALEFFQDNDLINSDGSDIKAYRESTAAHHSHAYVAEVSPPPGVADISPSEPITLLLRDDKTSVADGSVKISFNGADVTGQANIEKTGASTTVDYQPPVGRQSERNELSLEYMDSAGQTFTREWSFKNSLGDKPPKVTGQWDFSDGLKATIGADLRYNDDVSESDTEFGTTTEFGIPDIDGQPADVMCVPEDTEVGYLMNHGIEPNGGGRFVNRYTLLMDVMQVGGGAASAIFQGSPGKNPGDATFFWQGGNMGQGGGGYNGDGTFIPDEWHRIGFSVDLAAEPPAITKWVDGVFQDTWTAGMSLDHRRRAIEPETILFYDVDERSPWYVNSIQILDGPLSDEDMEALGGPTAEGFEAPSTTPFQIRDVVVGENGDVTVSWDSRPGRSYTIEASNSLDEVWLELTDGWPSQGESTAFTEEAGEIGDATERYYRIVEE